MATQPFPFLRVFYIVLPRRDPGRGGVKEVEARQLGVLGVDRGEAGLLDEAPGPPVQVAPVGELDLHRRGCALLRGEGGVRLGQHVLEEEELAARPEHAPHLGEDPLGAGDRAERECADHGVGGAIRQGQHLAHAVRHAQRVALLKQAGLGGGPPRVRLHRVVRVQADQVHALRSGTLAGHCGEVLRVGERAHAQLHHHGVALR
mmetsp:Transcript_31064/g.102467  ORF Transcript_31064/g.102467 Transcript_31064/m.102467 type:complete len:204 (-) Transcript_31064:1101-1712(-)